MKKKDSVNRQRVPSLVCLWRVVPAPSGHPSAAGGSRLSEISLIICGEIALLLLYPLRKLHDVWVRQPKALRPNKDLQSQIRLRRSQYYRIVVLFQSRQSPITNLSDPISLYTWIDPGVCNLFTPFNSSMVAHDKKARYCLMTLLLFSLLLKILLLARQRLLSSLT